MRRFTGHTEPWGQFLDVKINAPDILEKELSKNPQRGITFLGSVTDAYQPLEKKYRLTRAILECLLKYDFPISILTKSALVTRDLDLFRQFRDCQVGLTITATDKNIARHWEAGASSTRQRLEALEKLHQAGITTYVFLGPILPKLTDLEAIFEATHDKVDFFMFESLNLKRGNQHSVEAVLESHYPHLLSKYKAGFVKNYWDAVEIRTKHLAHKYHIPHQGFFRH